MGGLRVLFSAVEIAARVDTLAAEIARTVPDNFVVVGLLKGAAVFVADLIRALDRAGRQPELEFGSAATVLVIKAAVRSSLSATCRPASRGDQCCWSTTLSIPDARSPMPPLNCTGAVSTGCGNAHCSTSRSAGKSTSRSISSGSRSAISLLSAMAPTTPRNTAICRISPR
jgi:hypothetical protein